MTEPVHTTYVSARRIIRYYLWILLATLLVFVYLHYFYSHVKIGRVYWFNLDKERNISTWFSGMLFFLFACASFIAFSVETMRNKKDGLRFRLPILWVVVGLVGLYMSLDEITILHENLFWREIRHVTSEFSNPWKYITQWQIVFAPAIVIILGFFALFFTNRFSISSSAKRYSFVGIGCWISALMLEGLRQVFKGWGHDWYAMQVMIEETFEMAGAILILAAIVSYVIDINYKFSSEGQQRLKYSGQFLTKKSLSVLVMLLFVLSAGSTCIYLFAQQQAASGAPIPGLFKRALRYRSQSSTNTPAWSKASYSKNLSEALSNTLEKEKLQATLPDERSFTLLARRGQSASMHLNPKNEPMKFARQSVVESSKTPIWFGDVTNDHAISYDDAVKTIQYVVSSINSKTNPSTKFPKHLLKDKSPRIVFLSISDTHSPASVIMGSGDGIYSALLNAVAKAKERITNTNLASWIKLDIVNTVQRKNNTRRFVFKKMLREFG